MIIFLSLPYFPQHLSTKINSTLNNAEILVLVEAGSWGGKSTDFGVSPAHVQIVLPHSSLRSRNHHHYLLGTSTCASPCISLCLLVHLDRRTVLALYGYRED